MQMPNETWDDYKARYRAAWEPLRSRVLMGTAALGANGSADISRDEEDYFLVHDHTEDDSNYDKPMDHFWVGSWITGFGFFNVKFPKATSRPVTDEEWEWFLDNPVSL